MRVESKDVYRGKEATVFADEEFDQEMIMRFYVDINTWDVHLKNVRQNCGFAMMTVAIGYFKDWFDDEFLPQNKKLRYP